MGFWEGYFMAAVMVFVMTEMKMDDKMKYIFFGLASLSLWAFTSL